MANLIDSLVVTLGLDSSQFTKGNKDAQDSLKKTEQASNKTSREMEGHAKKMSEGFGNLKGELLAIGALLAGAFGIKDFVMGTIQQTAALGRMSSNLDMSKVRLAEWQQAVVMAGGTSEEATAQLKSHAAALAEFGRTGKTEGTILGQTQMYSGYYTKKPFIPQNVHGAEDLLEQQADIIRAIAKKDGNASASEAAGKMGISSENFFNILKDGSESLKNNLDSFKDVAESQAKLADSSEELRKETLKLKNEFTTMGNEIMPMVITGLQSFEDLLNNKDFNSGLHTAALDLKFFGRVVSETWKALYHILSLIPGVSMAKDIIEAAGKEAATTFATKEADAEYEPVKLTKDAKKRLSDLSNGSKSSAPSSSDNTSIVGKLVAMGWSPAQAAGIAGSLKQESNNFNPADTNPDSHMYGIAQWDTKRRKKFEEIMGKSIYGSSVDDQLKFMNWELNNSHKLAGDKIRAAKTPAEAAQAHSDYYEMASKTGKWSANDSQRAANASNLLAAYQSSNAASVSSVPLAFKQGGSSSSSNSTTSTTTINTINVNTQATDATGISNDIGAAIRRTLSYGANNLNTGLS